MTKARVLVALLVIVVLFACVMKVRPLLSVASSATALAAQQACSLHLAAGLPLEWAVTTYVNPQVQPLSDYLEVAVDQRAGSNSVRASLKGWLQAEAVHRQGFGCSLLHGQPLVDVPSRVRVSAPTVRLARRVRLDGFRRKRLTKALDNAFAEPDPSARRHTLAVMVLHEGKLVAERYAPGIEQATPLPGFSMTKAMTAASVGLLVQHKGLSVEAIKSAVGLPVSDTLNVDARALAQLFQKTAGNNDLGQAFEFLRQHLLKPMRLQSLQLEVDAAGILLGSSSMLASTLDWAKLGQLYLQDGVWRDQRLLPAGWASYIGRATFGGGGASLGNRAWLPEDAISLHGTMNQAVFVLPSHSLVIVRLGATRSFGQSGERELVAEVIGSMR